MTLGDGSRRNALAPADWQELAASVRALDLTEVQVVVIRGADGTFSSGSDIRFWSDATEREVNAHFVLMEEAIRAVEDVAVPTLAVVEGVAAGAGCQLALACDLRMMAESATAGMPVARLGISVSPAFVERLALGVGRLHALDLLYTGRMISAAEAAELQFATIVPDVEVDTRVGETLSRLCRLPRASLVATKAATRRDLQTRRDRTDSPEWRYTVPEVFTQQVDRFLRHELAGRD